MFDPSVIEFGGITLIALVFGLVEFFRTLFNLEGKAVTTLAMVAGLLVYGIAQLFQFLPPGYEQYAQIVYQSIAFGLAAAGFYKFATRNE